MRSIQHSLVVASLCLAIAPAWAAPPVFDNLYATEAIPAIEQRTDKPNPERDKARAWFMWLGAREAEALGLDKKNKNEIQYAVVRMKADLWYREHKSELPSDRKELAKVLDELTQEYYPKLPNKLAGIDPEKNPLAPRYETMAYLADQEGISERHSQGYLAWGRDFMLQQKLDSFLGTALSPSDKELRADYEALPAPTAYKLSVIRLAPSNEGKGFQILTALNHYDVSHMNFDEAMELFDEPQPGCPVQQGWLTPKYRQGLENLTHLLEDPYEVEGVGLQTALAKVGSPVRCLVIARIDASRAGERPSFEEARQYLQEHALNRLVNDYYQKLDKAARAKPGKKQ